MNNSPFIFAAFVFIVSCLSSADCQMCQLNNTQQSPTPPVTYNSGLKPYYNLAVDFIHAVHGKLSDDKIQNIINYFQTPNFNFDAKGFWNVVQPVVVQEIGYIILLVLGVGFMVLMPLVGLIFCCCRCCNACGGKRYQENPTCCCCSFLLTMVLVCLVFMVTGVVMYVVNNNEAYSNMKTVTISFLDQADVITGYLNETGNELFCATEAEFDATVIDLNAQLSFIPIDTTNYTMNVSGVLMLRDLQSSLFNICCVDVANIKNQWPALLNMADSVSRSISDFSTELNNFNPSSIFNQSVVTSELTYYAGQNNTIIGINVTFIQNFLDTYDLTAITQPAADFITNQIEPLLQSEADTAINALKSVNTTIVNVANNFTYVINILLSNVNNVTSNLNNTANQVLQNGVYGSYEWVQYVSLVIILPVFLACLFTFLGCCCGAFGHNGKAKPYQRGCCSNCGGNTLMCSVVTLFIFSWILMLICIVVFFFGFLSEGFVCQPIFEDPNIRGLDLVPNITINTSQSTWTISVKDSLLNCKADMAMYSAFQLQNAVNLNQIFQPIDKIAESVTNINVNSVDFTQTKIVGLPNNEIFTTLSDNLETLQNQLDNSSTVLTMQPVYTISAMQDATTFLSNYPNNATAVSLLQTAQIINQNLTEMLKLLSSLANYNNDADLKDNHIVADMKDILSDPADFNNPKETESLTNQFLNNELVKSQDSLKNFVTILNTTITQQVGKCRPVYDVFTNVGVILCQQLLYPLQGWWLALGWCLIFFIPAICFNVRLAKYFRTMDSKYYQDDIDRWSTDAIHLARINDNAPPIYSVVQKPNQKPGVSLRRVN